MTGFLAIHSSAIVATTLPDAVVFAVAALIILAGAVGVIVERNPVHSALGLVIALFGVALIFLLLKDDFLAAVQIIVYAGAIVVLFLFVIMFLGVDKREVIVRESLRGQRPLALALVLLAAVGILLLGAGAHYALGASSATGAATSQPGGEVAALGRSVFTTYLLPFEATAALFIIAILGAVVLTKGRGAPSEKRGEDGSAGDEPDDVSMSDGPGSSEDLEIGAGEQEGENGSGGEVGGVSTSVVRAPSATSQEVEE
ncbi:MAG: NADH-quinone oxidoreductase subunit J [Actinobacteria bacterium]|jgi:NADH-quinone oxidoreductase subunit J|nr:NADH-quinone oxidoreductase subunit J [Actinomycetota bacterium]